MNRKKFISFVSASMCALVAIFGIGINIASANITGDLPGADTPNFYIAAFNEPQDSPCDGTADDTETKYADHDAISGDATYNDDNDYTLTFSDVDATTYVYFCEDGTTNILANITVNHDEGAGNHIVELGRVTGNGLHADLDNDYVIVCDGATKLNTVSKQVAANTYNQFFAMDEQDSDYLATKTYFVANVGDDCTFDADMSTGKIITTTTLLPDNYGIYTTFIPDTKAVGDLHADLDAAQMFLYDTNQHNIALAIESYKDAGVPDGDGADDDYIIYYDKPSSGDMKLTITSAANGITTVNGIAYDAFTTDYDFVNDVEDDEDGVPTDIALITTTMSVGADSIVFSTVLHDTDLYDMYTDLGAEADGQAILFQKPAGTTVFQKGITSNVQGDDATDVAKISGETHDGLEDIVAADNIEVFTGADCTTEVSSTNVQPVVAAGDDYEVYFEDTDAVVYMKVSKDAATYTTCGNSVAAATFDADQGATVDFGIQVTGTVNAVIDRVAVDDDDANSDATDGSTCTAYSNVAAGVYYLYTSTSADLVSEVDAASNVFFVVAAAPTTELLERTKDLTADKTVNVAKVTGTTANVHADLTDAAGDPHNLVIYDATDGVTQISSETVNMEGAPYNQYFEVPTGLAANIEVQLAADNSKIFYVYNKTVAAAGSYTFEPLYKVATTAPTAVLGFELQDEGDTGYKMRDKTDSDVGANTVYTIYVDKAEEETPLEYDYEAYTDAAFTTEVLSRADKNPSADGTWGVAELSGDIHDDFDVTVDNDNVAIYNGDVCTVLKSSEGFTLTEAAIDTYTQFYETDAASNYSVRVTRTLGGNDYITCITTEAAQPAAGTNTDYDIAVKVSGNVGSGITIVGIDTAEDASDDITQNVVTATTPGSYIIYMKSDAQSDTTFYSAGPVEELEVEDQVLNADHVINVGKVSGASQDALATLVVYTDAACTLAASSEAENPTLLTGYTQYFEGTDATTYRIAVNDGTHTSCLTSGFTTTNQEATVNFDRKLSGSSPDVSDTTIQVLSVTANTGDDTYWVNTVDPGAAPNTYAIYVDDADTGIATTGISFKSAVTGGGTALVSTTKDLSAADGTANASAAHGTRHASIQDAGEVDTVCYSTLPTTNADCATQAGVVTAPGAGGTYEIFFEQIALVTAYFVQVYDGAAYYSWNNFTSGAAGAYTAVELDGKVSGTVVEAFDSVTPIANVLVEVLNNAGDTELARTYTIADGTYTAYDNDGDDIDARFSKGSYVTQTNEAGVLPQTLNINLVSGIKVTVKDLGTNPVTDAKVDIYICAGADPSACVWVIGTCTQPAGPCTRTGTNALGNGDSGEYFFAGITTGTYIQVRVSDPDGVFETVYSPDSSETVNSFVTSALAAVTPTVLLTNGVPEGNLDLIGGAGTYENATSLYADVGDDITVRYDAGEAGLTVTADLSAIGGGAAQALTDTAGVYTYTQTIGAVATTGTKTVTITASDGVNTDVKSIGMVVDNTVPTDPATAGDPGDVDLDGSVTWTWTAATDANSGLAYYEIDLDDNASCVSPIWTRTTTSLSYTVGGLTDGTTYYMCVQSYDNVGNVGALVDLDADGILIDTIPVGIVTTPASASYSAATLAVAGGLTITPDSTGTCKWDTYDAPYASMGATGDKEFAVTAATVYDLTSLADADDYTLLQGMNAIFVRCKDANNNYNLNSSSIMFSYDSVAPTYQLINGDTNGSNGKTVNGVIYANIGDTVRINFQASEALVANPTVTIGGQAMTFFSSDGGLYVYTRTLTGAETPTAVITIGDTTDIVGNADTNAGDGGVNFELDFTAPTVAVTAPGTQNSKSFLINATAEADSECRMDEQDLAFDDMNRFSLSETAAGTFEGTYIVATDGAKTIYVRCRDYAGNEGTGNTGAFTVDTTEPSVLTIVPTISGGWEVGATVAATLTTDVNATCRYDTNEADAYADMDNLFAGGGGTTHTATIANTDGQNYYYVLCQDANGVTMTSPITVAWKGDITNPSAPVRVLPAEAAKYVTGTVMLWGASTDAASGIASYTLQIDTDVAFGSPLEIAGLTSSAYALTAGNITAITGGTNYWRVQAVDYSGRVSGYEAGNRTVVIDKTAPTVETYYIANAETGVNISSDIVFLFDEEMDISTFVAANVQLEKTSAPGVPVAIGEIVGSPHFTLEGVKKTELWFTPTANLAYNTEYTVVLTNAIKDVSGNAFAGIAAGDYTFTTAAQAMGSLGIDYPIIAIKQTGTPDNTYANGFEWVMRITLPVNQPNLSIQFADWTSTLPTANNMQYYSEQIAAGVGSAASPVPIAAANTYPANVAIGVDADTSRDGIQTDIHIMLKIPAITPGGNHTTTFKVRAQ